jgi:hypothetical protein
VGLPDKDPRGSASQNEQNRGTYYCLLPSSSTFRHSSTSDPDTNTPAIAWHSIDLNEVIHG